MQGADADEAAVAADQRGAAPERVGRCGEYRAVEQVFPITGEFLAGNDRRRDGVTASALGREDGVIARPDPHVRADVDRRNAQPAKGLHEPEPGLLVVAQHVPGYRAAEARGQPDRTRLR